ncbi:hypothetical protein FRC07_009009 [Ceratobasidium sp. 392]|nr:hypothetical protein FRC07_009009 [Ceratobasidium sp. 392]
MSATLQGNLIPIYDFNTKTSCSGIYLNRGTQTTPEPEPQHELESQHEPEPESRLEPILELQAESELEPIPHPEPEPISLPFSATSTTLLPSNIRRTQELVNRYFENIDETKHVLFQSSFGLPTLPEDVWTDILANRYVDLGRIHFAYKPTAHAISTFLQWKDVFTAYQTGVCIAFPHRKEEFQTWFDNVKILFKLHTAAGYHRVIRAERMQRRAIFDSHTRTLDDKSSIKELHSALSKPLISPFLPPESPKPLPQEIKHEPVGPATNEELIGDDILPSMPKTGQFDGETKVAAL